MLNIGSRKRYNSENHCVIREATDGCSPVVPIPAAFKLIEDAIILIEGTQLAPEIFMHLLKENKEETQSYNRQLCKNNITLPSCGQMGEWIPLHTPKDHK